MSNYLSISSISKRYFPKSWQAYQNLPSPLEDTLQTQQKITLATLQAWGTEDSLQVAALFSPWIYDKQNFSQPEDFDKSTHEYLNQWQELLALALQPDLNTHSLMLRKLMRIAYLNLPLALLVTAHHKSRTETAKGDDTLWQETQEVFMPFCYMLGLWNLRRNWREKIHKARHLQQYNQVTRQLKQKQTEQAKLFTWVQQKLEGVIPAGVTIQHQKITPGKILDHADKGKAIESYLNHLIVNVVTQNEETCYRLLNFIHKLGHPQRGTFTDHIAEPRMNGYRALHTFITGKTHSQLANKTIEFRLYTTNMNKLNQMGVVATQQDSQYKQVKNCWWNKENQDIKALLEAQDIATPPPPDSQLYIFTPRGEIKTIKANRTALDFAYSLHTHIGHKCREVRINGQKADHGAELFNGDLVELVHDPFFPGPLPSWLHLATSQHTKEKIRSGLGIRAQNSHPGRRRLDKYLRSLEQDTGFVIPEVQVTKHLSYIAQQHRIGTLLDLYEKVIYETQQGRGVFADQLIAELLKLALKNALVTHDGTPITADGIKFCTSCKPIPNVPILLYQKKKGNHPNAQQVVTVHRYIAPQKTTQTNRKLFGLPYSKNTSCSNLQQDRINTNVTWAKTSFNHQMATIDIIAKDRPKLTTDLLQPINNDETIYLIRIEATTREDGTADLTLIITYQASHDMLAFKTQLEQVQGVERVAIWPTTDPQVAHLRARTGKHTPNPYHLTPVADQKMFFGRENEIIKICDYFRNTSNKLLILHGQRRAGKTSLAKMLPHHRLYTLPMRTIFVDLQELGAFDLASIYYFLASAICRKVGLSKSVLPPPQPPTYKTEAFQVFKGFLQSLQEAIKPQRLLLILDEFNLLAYQTINPSFFNQLRALTNDETISISFLLITYTSQVLGHTENHEVQTLYSQGIHLQLDMLDTTSAKRLIKDPAKGHIEYDPEVVTHLTDFTGRNPFLIQLLCHRILNHFSYAGRNYVRVADLKQIVKDTLLGFDGRTYFQFLTEHLKSVHHKRFIQTVAHRHPIHHNHWWPLSDIAQELDISNNHTNTIAGYLEAHGLITRQAHQVRLSVTYFGDWVAKIQDW